MKLAPGQTILLKNTRERATVVKDLDNDQYLVEAAMDKERFTVSGDDIDPVIATATSSTTVQPQEQAGDIRLYPGTTGAAVQLAFLPAGELDYNVAILNHSDEILVFAARLLSHLGQQWSRHGVLGPTRGLQLGHLYRDLMNEGAHIELQVSRKGTNGTDSKQDRDLNLKPKSFYKNVRSVDWYPDELTVMDVFAKAKLERATPPPPPPPAPVKTIGAPAPESVAAAKLATRKKVLPYTIMAAAEFPRDLDLHIEHLVDDKAGLSNEEIVQIQLEHVRQYLDRAIRLGIDKVYLIHGKGSGALRNRVHQQLTVMGDLEGFKNEYHPKYDYGATEVRLR